MSNPSEEETSPSPLQETGPALEGGTYEIIRNRLRTQSNDLNQRITQLNTARKEVFGSIETQMLTSERVTTEYNCLPRDMVPVGKRFLFGYNIFLGLKSETSLSDVFSVYSYKDRSFHAESLDLLDDQQFKDDFFNLYKYYRETQFVKFAEIGPFLYLVFQIGKDLSDIKAFKWQIGENKLTYVDNRSDHEVVFPDQHEFRWQRTSRESYRHGLHPHISIEDRVFVETVSGDLTIKVEDNTNTGQGIFSEPVDHPDQTLDDAEVFYAVVGNLIVLKIKPYQEQHFRYIVFNQKLQDAIRIDALEDSCVLLPSDHGLIFAKGYYLQSGEYKLFEHALSGMLFERRVASPNGEDFLNVFYNQVSGTYILLSYNLIEQEVKTPIVCHGFSIFPNGELAFFRGDEEQKKHHVVQIWQTPYLDHNLPETQTNDSFLYDLGNKDIVRAMAECREVIKLCGKEDSYANLYLDLVNLTADVQDSFHWLSHEEAFNLTLPLKAIRETASSAVDEFDKVRSIRKNTASEVARIEQVVKKALRGVKNERADSIHYFVNHLSELRKVRGEVISIKELRYVDIQEVEIKEKSVTEAIENLSSGCVSYLLKPEALNPYRESISTLKTQIEKLNKVVDANRLETEITDTSSKLEMLIEIVSNLKIEDATHTTRIIDAISAIYSGFNRIIAALRQKRKELKSSESEAEFAAQIKLVEQGMLNYLDISETPEKCDDYLSKLMIQLEELEGKFAEFDNYLAIIAEKREDLYNAFEAKKVSLVEQRNRRANALQQSAVRIINGVTNRVRSLDSVSEINGYFAGDLMVDKVRDILKQMQALGDTVKVDELQSRLKTAQEEAVRQLKDKQELFTDGDDLISLGRHRFLVNRQDLDLTVVPKQNGLYYHLTGTNFYEEMTGEEVEQTRSVWNQLYPSETAAVYRGEYLAYLLYQASIAPTRGAREVDTPEHLLQKTPEELAKVVQTFMAPRFQEGYVKGVHDQDGARILAVVLTLHQSLGLLRYAPPIRAAARMFWETFISEEDKNWFTHRLTGMGGLLKAFPHSQEFGKVIHDLQDRLSAMLESTQLFAPDLAQPAAEYLFFQLVNHTPFVISHRASELRLAFDRFLKAHQHQSAFDASLKDLLPHPVSRYGLILNWLRSFASQLETETEESYLVEAAVLLFYNINPAGAIVSTSSDHEVDELLGNHSRVEKGKMHLHFHEYIERLKEHFSIMVPRFELYQEWKKEEISQYRKELRLQEFKPRILSSFVRNMLISNVYLPLIGDNLAKQIGTAGEAKRTDLMGMLLLISPPGYGKTTLMEYVSHRLGLIFLKVNGPAIGHQVTSLDPEEAPNASAREELEKLNLGFEMGDNVMIYVDDIQHCHPEFLQKFISLCDAQRKIEGVFKGVSRTYDLRGRRVCVVMAGNPYTESGDKFQIPDMLANRADIYNLGDILGDTESEFKLSYLENGLTSNPSLARMASKSQKDLHPFLAMAERGSKEGLDFEANHTPQETSEYVAVLQKLIKVRDVILKVNMEYIRSAAQADEFRTEPAFKLQGSYRNMNKLAEKVVPIMNEEELERMLLDYYHGESQTLTTGAEANLLKFKEMMGWISQEESERWTQIKTTFQKNNRLSGMGNQNQFGQMLVSVEAISEGLIGIQKALHSAGSEETPSS